MSGGGGGGGMTGPLAHPGAHLPLSPATKEFVDRTLWIVLEEEELRALYREYASINVDAVRVLLLFPFSPHLLLQN